VKLRAVGYGGHVAAVLMQMLGAVLLVAAVAVWSWPMALGLAGALLIVGGAVAEWSGPVGHRDLP